MNNEHGDSRRLGSVAMCAGAALWCCNSLLFQALRSLLCSDANRHAPGASTWWLV